MRPLGRVLLLCGCLIAPSLASGAAETGSPEPRPSPAVAEPPAWPRPAQAQSETDPGFAPLSVTQSGVAYSPAAPVFDPAGGDEPKIADLPAWASSYFATEPDRRQARPTALGVLGFGALPEPAAWALILIGTAMICGALRGLIMANRRLDRLRDDDDARD